MNRSRIRKGALGMPRPGLLLAVLVFLAAVSGCQSSWHDSPVFPDPPTEAERAKFGKIGVAAMNWPADLKLDAPARGSLHGLGVGAGRGAVSGVYLVLKGAVLGAPTLFGALVGASIGAACAVVYFPVSIVGGISTAEAPERVKAADAVIRNTLNLPEMQRTLRTRIVRSTGALTGRRLIPLESGTSEDPTIDSILLVGVVQVQGGPVIDLWTVNRPFSVTVTARLRLIQARTGATIYEADSLYRNPQELRTYVQWAAGGGRYLRLEIDRGLTEIADQLVEEVFLLHPLKE